MSDRTFKLSGNALKLAKEYNELVKSTNVQIDSIMQQAMALRDAGNKKCDEFMTQLRIELKMPEGEHCHIDVRYLDEFGLAFARTNCEVEPNPMEALLSSLVPQPETKPN